MGLTLTNSSGPSELCPAGPAYAQVVRIIDMGTQQSEYKGAVKYVPKVIITWAVEHLMSDGKFFYISEWYTAMLSENSNLTAMITGWRGLPFTEEELSGFDIKKLLGLNCSVNIIHRVAKTGRTFAKIDSVSKLRPTDQPPQFQEPLISFDLDHFDPVVYDGLSSFYKETIAKSPEYQALMAPVVAQHNQMASPAYTPSPALGNVQQPQQVITQSVPMQRDQQFAPQQQPVGLPQQAMATAEELPF